jgi:Holliday junction resolvase RusA-like endonuclease
MKHYVVHDINPCPWMAPKLGVARSRGGVYPVAYPTDEMKVYKAAVQDYFAEQYPTVPVFVDAPLYITIWYWRSLNFGGQRRNRCDVTNLNKCLEDALQGVLYANDRHNRIVAGVMVEQAPHIAPKMIIRVQDGSEIPEYFTPPELIG